MNCTQHQNSTFWTRFYSLIAAVLTIGFTSYFIVPMLPIYCVESASCGGLGWTRSEACALYGTYLLVAHIAPFFGGFLADFLFGRYISVLIGYLITAYGLLLLWFFPETMMVTGFLALALGIGCVKVGLAVAIGQLCSGSFLQHRAKGYDQHYFMACLGFIGGNFFSNILFNMWGMRSLLFFGSSFLFISIFCYFLSRPQTIQSEDKSEEEQSPHQDFLPWFTVIGMLLIGIVFFMCGNQLNSSISLFLHQQVDRSFLGWTIPTLWFSVFGFLVATSLTPLRRRLWKPFENKIPFVEPIKMAVGFCFLATGFLLLSYSASYRGVEGGGFTLLLILVAMGLFFISDVHVRPLLFSSATKFSPPQYRTMASAVVYSTVGFGGKLAGSLAGTTDTLGFSWLFSFCAIVGCTTSLMSLLIWKRQKQLLAQRGVQP